MIRRRHDASVAPDATRHCGGQAAGLTDALPLDRNRTWGLGVPGQVYGPGHRPTAFVYITDQATCAWSNAPSHRAGRREVLTDTLRLALAGVALGMTASALLARVLATLLYGTSPGDPLTFAGTAALLVTVAAIAGFIPALRASRVDPMTALRME